MRNPDTKPEHKEKLQPRLIGSESGRTFQYYSCRTALLGQSQQSRPAINYRGTYTPWRWSSSFTLLRSTKHSKRSYVDCVRISYLSNWPPGRDRAHLSLYQNRRSSRPSIHLTRPFFVQNINPTNALKNGNDATVLLFWFRYAMCGCSYEAEDFAAGVPVCGRDIGSRIDAAHKRLCVRTNPTIVLWSILTLGPSEPKSLIPTECPLLDESHDSHDLLPCPYRFE